MSLILRNGADVESFERVVLARSNRINRCRLGPVILSLAVEGKNNGEIAEIVKAEGMGGDPPISASTISRWLRATGLFCGRGRSGAENRNMPAQVRGLLAAYEKEALSAVEETGREFLPKVGKTLRQARKKCLAEFFKEDERSGGRESWRHAEEDSK